MRVARISGIPDGAGIGGLVWGAPRADPHRTPGADQKHVQIRGLQSAPARMKAIPAPHLRVHGSGAIGTPAGYLNDHPISDIQPLNKALDYGQSIPLIIHIYLVHIR